MPKGYKHIKQYEKEILELRAKGLTHRETGEKSGFKKEQTEEFFHRYNRNQRKIASGVSLKHKGRPRKDGNHPIKNTVRVTSATLSTKNGFREPSCSSHLTSLLNRLHFDT